MSVVDFSTKKELQAEKKRFDHDLALAEVRLLSKMAADKCIEAFEILKKRDAILREIQEYAMGERN